MTVTYEGNLDDKHNLNGTMHKPGEGEDNTCVWSWGRVTFTSEDGSTLLSETEAIIPRCPNQKCSAVDLKVVDVKVKS